MVTRIRDIADVQNQCRFLYFFERGAKRRQQAFRQVTNKSYRVRQQHASVRGKPNRANGRVKRGEHFRGDQHFGTAKCIEQCRLARIRIAHQRDGSQRNGIAGLTAERPLFAYLIDIGFNPAHALANPAAISFQFLFTRAADADTPRAAACSPCATSTALAAQAGHRDAFPGQAGQQVIQLRQLHL